LSCVCFFFFLLFLFLSSFFATYSSISPPPPPLLLSLNALSSPSFLVFVDAPLQFSTISSRLQDTIDEDTARNFSVSLLSPPKKKGRNTKKDIQFFFLFSFNAPTHSPSNFYSYDCATIYCVKCSLARSTSVATSRFVPLVRSSATAHHSGVCVCLSVWAVPGNYPDRQTHTQTRTTITLIYKMVKNEITNNSHETNSHIINKSHQTNGQQ
jgi:hypothetical protein